MSRSRSAGALIALVAALGAMQPQAEAVARKPTSHVGVTQFQVFTSTGARTVVARGGKHVWCEGTTIKAIYAEARVEKAKKGKKITVSWYRDGTLDSSFKSSWTARGNFIEYYSVAPRGIDSTSGTWRVVVQSKAGIQLGAAKFTLSIKKC